MSTQTLTYWGENTLYINASSRCSNSCVFCVRNFSDGVYGFNLRLDRDPTPEELEAAVLGKHESDFREIAIVGFGEPTVNLAGVLRVLEVAKRRLGLRTRMNSNGHGLLLYPDRDVPLELARAGLDEIQVSLNAPDAVTYLRLCRPKFGIKTFDSVIDFTKRCSKHMKTVISVVGLPGLDIEACKAIADRLEVGFRVREFKGPRDTLGEVREILRS
ncbi:radical SAM protein [Candidatus Thorarchaeota archaeon]|nr:MAG: radical SAM protein [Candidatus Thorarchaeota archaeon]